MTQRNYNVLFLCTGNSARSISIPDPAAAMGTEEQVRKAFGEAFFLLDCRISLLVNLPLSTMDRLALKKRTRRHRPLLISNRAPVCWRHCIP
jgi:hypothetical protein